MWYPISFLLSAAFLILWFYYSDNENRAYTFRQLFLFGISSYLVNWFSLEADWTQKLTVLSKDLIIMGTAAAFFGLIRSQKRLFWILFIISVLLGTSYYLKPLSAKEQVEKVSLSAEGEFLIELQSLEQIKPLQEKYNLLISKAFTVDHPTLLSDWYVIDVAENRQEELAEIKNALSKYGVIEDNEQITVAPIISRKLPKVNQKFGINDPGLQHLWGFEAMQIDQLYSYLKTSKIKPKKNAKIAILDTGIDAQHEDLKGNYYSTQTKYDNDSKGHGTHCAGIAAAVSNNALGVASFAPNSDFVSITSIKVLNNYGMGTQKGIIQGMVEAADNGVDVISMSLGAFSTDSRQKAYSEAVQYCKEKDVIIVVAAGNSNANARNYAPANAKGVIGVSALQQNLEKAVFSNTVQDLEMGIAAPGKDIYSCIPDSKYETFSGTSMATPYVAGLVALMRSLQPDLSAEQAYKILSTTGHKTKNGSATGNLIMPYKALKALE